MEKLQSSWRSVLAVTFMALSVWASSGAAISSASTPGDDASINSQVKTAIFQEPMLRTSFLNVETKGGVVRLSGNAERPVDVEIAKELAQRVPGVVEVRAELVTVRDHTAHGR